MSNHDHDNNSRTETSAKDSSEKAPKYWRSLEEWRKDPEFEKIAEKEFISSPFFEGELKDSWARRDFMKLMGASLALSSFACIRRPVQKIVPYVNRPVENLPGVANYYASTWVESGEGLGLLVKTREGRPIKLEGNPDHPVNGGALSARGQAQVLGLYDPARLKGPRKINPMERPAPKEGETAATGFEPLAFRHIQEPTWSQVDEEVAALLKEGGVALLTSSLASPSTRSVIQEFLSATRGELYVWDAIGADDVIEGQRASFGSSVLPTFRFDRAQMIVSIDADFLGTLISPVEFNRQWAMTRKPGADMSQLVVFESNMSLTGQNADVRFRIKPSQQVDVVLGLLAQMEAAPVDREIVRDYKDVATRLGLDAQAFQETAQKLWQNRGKSIVVAGGLPTRTAQSEKLHAAVNLLNSALGNDGVTIDHSNVPHRAYEGSYADLARLIEKMNAGQVKTLILHRVNPIYTLPADSGFEEALKKVSNVITSADRLHETAKHARYVVPDHHPLENWGDAELKEGVISIQQPTIQPLYDTRAFQDTLLTWTAAVRGGKASAWYDYLREQWRKNYFRGNVAFDTAWNQLLQVGVLDLSESARNRTGGARRFAATGLRGLTPSKSEGLELVLYQKIAMGDGTHANISWLQEMPDPVSKVTWDNYLNVSPATAKSMGLADGTVVKLTVGDKTIEVPVHIQPGLHDQVVSLAVGYGRSDVGDVGNNVGVNAFKLAQFNKGKPVFSGLSVKVEKTAKRMDLAITQGHHNVEGRQVVVATALSSFQKNPSSGIHRHEVFSIWQGHKYLGNKWGMAIDLNLCTGCSACVVACQAENNIPVVGKKYVLQGREMHWLRIDRYYSGTPDNPETVHQPMLCQHCENAPCETVCPVAATTHSDEGLNEMTYNRCVGTRYCSNNCPYKVRRFNWFNYANIKKPLNMAMNPDVTVRTRGVMEKCTFCVQRITVAKDLAKDQDRAVQDGEIKTACQQSCPTDAIVFGNLNDEKSVLRQRVQEKRSFHVLEEFNTQPRVTYMTKIRNAKAPVDTDAHAEEGGHS